MAQSLAAWNPTANHRLPVRRIVRHMTIAHSTMYSAPIQFSPGLERCHRPKGKDVTSAAGQKRIPELSVWSRYPRKQNSSCRPTSTNVTAQTIEYLAIAPVL